MPLNISKKTIFTEYGTEFVDDVEVEELTNEQLAIAEQVIDKFYKPMTALEITKEIARLQMIAPEREKTDVDIKARTAIWIEELLKYPADVVMLAFRRKYRWFPTLAEILDICDNEVAFRNLLKMKIRCSRNYL